MPRSSSRCYKAPCSKSHPPSGRTSFRASLSSIERERLKSKLQDLMVSYCSSLASILAHLRSRRDPPLSRCLQPHAWNILELSVLPVRQSLHIHVQSSIEQYLDQLVVNLGDVFWHSNRSSWSQLKTPWVLVWRLHPHLQSRSVAGGTTLVSRARVISIQAATYYLVEWRCPRKASPKVLQCLIQCFGSAFS